MTKCDVYASIMYTQVMCSDLMRTLLYIEKSVVSDFYNEDVDTESKKFKEKLNSVNAFFDEILNSSDGFLMDLDYDSVLLDAKLQDDDQ